MRIGIFGGSFDPVHLEHVKIACGIKEEFNLDKIIVVPAYLPPHKERLNVEGSHRLAMLKLAFENSNDGIIFDDFELNSKQVVYTYQTVRYFKEKFAQAELYLIVGADSFNNFGTWKNVPDIASNCDFIVVGRNGYPVDTNSVYFKNAHISKFTGTISSTQIRQAIKNNLDITELTDKKVMEYINENKLYK